MLAGRGLRGGFYRWDLRVRIWGFNIEIVILGNWRDNEGGMVGRRD